METATIETVPLACYDAYKDSGAEWLGEIPEHWEKKRVKFEIEYQKGRNPKELTFTETNYIYLSMEYLRGESQKILYTKDVRGLVKIERGDILLLWDGSNAGEFIKGEEGILSSTMAVIKIKSAKKKFAWYYVKVIERKLRETTVGMGIPHVSSHELKNLSFLLPPPEEQTRIADFLDRKTAQIDQAIAQKERLIALLQERRQVMIHQAVTQGLNPDVPTKDSGVEWIGKIPAHWEVVSNRSLFVEKNKPGNETLPILSVSIHTAVSSEELSEEDNIRGTIRIQDKSSYKRVDIGDIAFNMMRAWQGAIGAVSTKGMVSPAYIVAEPLGDIEAEFFEHQYRTSDFIQQMNRFSKGITDFRKRLYWEGFKQLKTVLPPKAEQIAVVKFIEKFSSKTEVIVERQKEAIRTLKEYRATLINSAVTGKIKV